ncbi:MAG: hypothetical protein ABIX46_01650 [Burkholderiaceae bacterium]
MGEASPQGLGGGALADAAAAEVAAPLAVAEPTRSSDTPTPVGVADAMPSVFNAASIDVATPVAVVEPVLASLPKATMATVEPVQAVEAAAPVAVSAEAFALPVDSLEAIAKSAGLEWVNSDVEKIRAVQSEMDSQPAPVRVPRERKPVAAVDDGPLVLVETRKDLSQFKLPFEKAAQPTAPRD